MHRRVFPALSALIALTALAGPARAELPTIAEKTEAMRSIDGFVPMHWEESTGTLWLEVREFDAEMIYVTSLATGLGSNDIGLDRSQLGEERVVFFHRVGPRVMLVQPNLDYRAVSDNADERRAVEESFARSILWGFEVAAESDGAVLVDATEFALRDARDVEGTLAATEQGKYSLDAKRSLVYLPRTKGFPRNSEIEAELTFSGTKPGAWLRSVAPTPEAVSVRQHHSFVALPEPGYEPRASHPGGGFFGISYADYATPIGEPIQQRFIARHRLEKKDPQAAESEAVEPIVYYLDRGAPEPVRSALLEGARWWNEAFTAAGFRDAFRVEMLPEGADPMDVRYNVIQWVHRSTRGWSYGASVGDPRTGEIIKGHVLLGSLRVRQDYLLAEGLLGPYESGDAPSPAAEAFALARLRQLSAHEVGHTLGLAHNFAASSYGYESVMDYPHPLVALAEDGSIDVSEAYAEGIGEWDKIAVTFGYKQYADGVDERAEREEFLLEAREWGIEFISDADARPQGGAHPRAHLWDNEPDPVAELERVMEVRRVALDRFSERAIRRGAPLATLEEALVPLYLHHRYQVEATVKLVAGLDYSYALRGDGSAAPAQIAAGVQLGALDALLRTLEPSALALPPQVRTAIPPRPFTYGRHRELFPRYSGLVFDPVAPAEVAARHTVGLILHPERAARLVEQAAVDPDLPGLDAVLDRLEQAAFGQQRAGSSHGPYEAELARTAQRVVAEELMRLAADADMPQARAVASAHLDGLATKLARGRGDRAQQAHQAMLVADIRSFLSRDYDERGPRRTLNAPPGSPIGTIEACSHGAAQH